jgi:hypothetical protein
MNQRVYDILLVFVVLIWFVGMCCNKYRYPNVVKNTAYYLDIQYDTGDLLLVGGGSGIQWVTDTEFVHAAMIYKHPATQQLFVCHLDVYGGFQKAMITAHKLVKCSFAMHPLYRYLEKNKEHIILRKLSPPYKGQTCPLEAVEHILFDNASYVRKFSTYWPTILPSLSPNPIPVPFASCDETIAILYSAMGIFHPLQKPLVINQFRHGADHNLPWRSSYCFLDEVFITLEEKTKQETIG